jgi:hypothetical protein
MVTSCSTLTMTPTKLFQRWTGYDFVDVTSGKTDVLVFGDMNDRLFISVLLDRFVPFNSAGSHEKGRQGAVHVYFRAQGSLSSPITEETLRRFLETYGELEHVIIRTYGHNAEVISALSCSASLYLTQGR